MAMEIKTLDISNDAEDTTIQIYQDFGWSLKSSQRVFNRDSHLESEGDSVYSVTKTVDYTKLVFERDKSMPHYKEIKELEDRFFYLLENLPDRNSVMPNETMEAWATRVRPDIKTNRVGYLGCIPFFVGAFVATVVGLYFDSIPLFFGGVPTGIIGGIVYCKVFTKISEASAIKGAVNGTNSKARAKLEALFNPLHEASVQRVEYLEAMPRLRKEASALVQ